MPTMPEPKKFGFTNYDRCPIFGVTMRSHLIGALVVQEETSVSSYYGVQEDDLAGICETHGFDREKLLSDLLKMREGPGVRAHNVFIMADQYRGN